MTVEKVAHILPEPELIERDDGFLVTLFKDRFSEEQLQQLDLNERQVDVLLFLKKKGEITSTATELQDIMDGIHSV